MGPTVVAITLGLVLGSVDIKGIPSAPPFPAALAVAVLISLNHIRAEEIDFARASGAAPADPHRPERVSRAALLKNRRLLIFAACAALFQLARCRS